MIVLLILKHIFRSYLVLKGGYLDFSHLTGLKKIYITEIYMQKKSSIVKNHKITNIFFYGIPLTHYQTTDFRLFQTERVCRRQIQI